MTKENIDIISSLKAFEVPGVKVLRLESPLYFGNVERFRSALVAAAGLDPSTQQQPRKEVKLASNDSDEKDELLENENGADSNCNEEIPNGVSQKRILLTCSSIFTFKQFLRIWRYSRPIFIFLSS